MAKPLTFLLLLVAAIIAAGISGALLNALSFAIGGEGPGAATASEMQSPLGAALVGWRESWWVGLLIGLPVFGLGLVLLRPRIYGTVGLGALFVVLLCALTGALLGLAFGLLLPGFAATLVVPEGETVTTGFLRATVLQEGVRIGCALGLVAALWTVWTAARSKPVPQRQEEES